jgi:cold shock CspA family protein
METRERGEVIRWTDKGFGFLRIHGRDGSVFLHLSAIENGLEPNVGDQVTCEVVDSATGLRAEHARIERGAR